MEFFDFTNIANTLTTLITGDTYYTYYWACLVVGAVGFAVIYSLEAAALYTIAKNNGYKKRWMAFVPFFNTYYFGVLAEKNKTFNAKTKNFSLALAIIEAVCVALNILYTVSIFLLFHGDGKYLKAVYENFYNTWGELIGSMFTGNYETTGLPANLDWAWWVFSSMHSYILSTLQLAYLVLMVFVLSSFFRTYSARNYMVFTILSVIFPIKAIFMFCVRKNKAVNYMDYMRERQKRQYDAYQQYMRNNGGYNGNNPNGGYGGGATPNGGGAAQSGGAGGVRPTPDDPFGGLGDQGGNPPPDDPFDDMK